MRGYDRKESRMKPLSRYDARTDAKRYAAVACAALSLFVNLGCTKSTSTSTAQRPRVVIPDGNEDNLPVCTQIRASGTVPLVDDFEAEQDQILANDGREGFWFGYDDGTGGKVHRERVEVDGSARRTRVLHVTSSGFTKWGSGFGVGLHPLSTISRRCAYDASAYVGVRLRARGQGRVRLTLGDMENTPTSLGGTCKRAEESCYDRPGRWLNLEADWRTFEVPFCAMKPEGWSGVVEGIDPASLVEVQFLLRDTEGTEVWLDDLTFYRRDADAPAPSCDMPCPMDAVPSSAIIAPEQSDAPLSEELSLHVFQQATASCGPITRRYLSYVPRRLPPRSAAPVLMVLHGSGANAEAMRNWLTRNRFDALAERDGFVVVYGNAAPGEHTSADRRIKNSGSWRQGFYDDGQVDDIEYLRLVLKDLVARSVISGDNAVLLTGLSNGGGMVLEGARRLYQSVSGVAALMPYDGPRPKPVPNLSSSRLSRVLVAYTINDPGMMAGYHETLAPLPAQWAQAMGLPAAVITAPKKSMLQDLVSEGAGYQGDNEVALATRDSHVTEFDMASPDVKGQVRVLVLDHAGHLWPNPEQFTEQSFVNRFGFRNQDFDAADMVWDFLRGSTDDSADQRGARIP